MYKITWCENIPIGDFKAVEHRHCVVLAKGEYWYNGGLIYYRRNRFEVGTISTSCIINVEKVGA